MARWILILALLASFLAMPIASAGCKVKVVRKTCHCCAGKAVDSCCGSSGKPECNSAQPVDRSVQGISKIHVAPFVFTIAEIDFPADRPVHFTFSKTVAEIPSPPPLELNCIRLI